MTIDRSQNNNPSAYGQMLAKLDEIEQALDLQDPDLIAQLSRDVEHCLEQIKQFDRQSTQPATAARRVQLEELLTRNQALAARIREITALQRNELNQLKIGMDTARGYASHHARRTGSIINSSN